MGEKLSDSQGSCRKSKDATAYRPPFADQLTDKDLAFIAKNREIKRVIVTQARRLVLNKNKR